MTQQCPRRRWGFILALAVSALPGLLVDFLKEPTDRPGPSLAGLAFAAELPKTPGAKLGVTILRAGSDSRAVIVPGQKVTVSIGVNNLRGDTEALAAVLTVTLPDGLKLEQARPAPDKREPGAASSKLAWNLGTVAAGTFPRLFALDLTSNGNVTPDTKLSLSATVASGDGDAAQPRASAAFTLLVKPAVTDLAVSSSLDAVAVTVSEPVKFTVEVGNWGFTLATASTLTVKLPPKVTFTSSDPAPTAADANTATWELGDIEPAGSRSVTITVTVDPSLVPVWLAEPDAAGALTFVFDAATTAAKITPAHNHLEIAKRVELAGPDLKVWIHVEGADEPGELPVGKDVKYVVGYGNFGNRPAAGVTVSLSLPEGLTLLGAEPKPAGAEKSDKFAGGVMSWNVGDLGTGDSKTVTASVHVTSVPDDGSLSMATIASPRGMDIDPRNDVAYADLRAQGAAGRRATTQGGSVQEPQAQGGKAGEPQPRGGTASGAGRGGHVVRNFVLAAIALVAVLWAARRATRRDVPK